MELKKILITGSNGLLGQAIVTTMLEENKIHLAYGCSNKRNICAALPENQFSVLDVTEYQEVLKLFKEIKPDIVIHTAGKTNVDACELHPVSCQKVNVEGARNVALASKHIGAHLIHLSTDFIFDGKAGPYDEHDEPYPQSVYGRCKLESELIVSSILPNSAIIRTALVFGWFPEMSRGNFMVWVKKSLEENREIRVVCDQFRTPTYIYDLANACLKAAELKVGGVFHVSGSEFYSVFEFAQMIADVFGLPRQLIKPIETHILNEPAKRPYITGFEIGKASRILHYSPTPLTEALAEIKESIDRFESYRLPSAASL
jgi:dTDP-4-dehydrorhamnose reductase